MQGQKITTVVVAAILHEIGLQAADLDEEDEDHRQD